MDDVEFLPNVASDDGPASVMVLLPDGTVTQIHNVSPFRVLEKCPLLYHAFEDGAHGIPQASLEATSRGAVVSLLRFSYTGSYLVADQRCALLLPHVEAFKIGHDFDVPELQVSAYVNFTTETEISCSLPTPPPDLCNAIRFLYTHFADEQSREQQSLVDTLLNYCLATFSYQRLGERADFRAVVFDTPAFHRDLCKTNMQRDFRDDGKWRAFRSAAIHHIIDHTLTATGASEIMLLPVCRPTPYSQDKLNKRVLRDFQFELFADDDVAMGSDRTQEQSHKRRKSSVGGDFTLVHRPTKPHEAPTFSETESDTGSSSDEEGFALVYRPRALVDTCVKTVSPDTGVLDALPVQVAAVDLKHAPQDTASDQTPVEDDWALV